MHDHGLVWFSKAFLKSSDSDNLLPTVAGSGPHLTINCHGCGSWVDSSTFGPHQGNYILEGHIPQPHSRAGRIQEMTF